MSRPDGGCFKCGLDFTVGDLLNVQPHYDPKLKRKMMFGWCPKCGNRMCWYKREKRVIGVGFTPRS